MVIGVIFERQIEFEHVDLRVAQREFGSKFRGGNTCPNGELDQFGQIINAEFQHDAAAISFDRLGADREYLSDFFGASAFD